MLIAVVSALPVGASPGPGQAGVVASANPLRIWALQSENRNSNYIPVAPDQALLDAFHFSYIIAHPTGYVGQVALMKVINPQLLILSYENALFAQRWQATAYPDSWYLRDASGNKVFNPVSHNYLMNPTEPGWIQDRTQTCESFVIASGYDGCYLDMLGIASMNPTFVSAKAINPATGQPWTTPDWINATSSLAAQVTSNASVNGSPVLVMGNGINSGQLYYSKTTPTKPILNALDGGIAEAWLRGSSTAMTKFPQGSTWLDDVQLVADAESSGKPLLGIVKVGLKTATAAQLAQWQQFGLATFLMATEGRSAYLFSPTPTTSRTSWYSMYNLALGSPTGSMTKLAGQPGFVYQRPFMYGLAIVNDNTSAAKVSIAGGPYYDVNGKVVGTSPLTVPPFTGLVLRTALTPVTTVTGGPGSPTTATSATITFASDTAGATFSCALDGGAAQSCTSPFSLSSLALGPHVLSVQATSPSGVVGLATPYAWDINDGTKPVVTFGPLPGSGASTTASFSSSSPESSFTCSLDGARAALCTSPVSLTGLATGVTHTFRVTATDPYGVVGKPAIETWTA
jgi:hypothetical protein